jgi:hypothetical protein
VEIQDESGNSSKTVSVGDTFQLSYTIYPNIATEQRVLWDTSKPTVATVDADGVVTAHSEGIASIFAYDWDSKGTRGKFVVRVGAMTSVESIALNQTNLSLSAGQSYALSATVLPSNATMKTVEWSCSNPDVVKVNMSSGLVYAKNVGTATVYATACDGSGVVCSCAVTVDHTIRGVPVRVKNNTQVNLMDAPDGSILGTLTNGTEVILLDETPQDEFWYNVYGTMSNGVSYFGWCSGEYLEKETTFLKHSAETKPSYVRNDYSLNDNNIVGEISYGMQVELVQEKAENNDGYDWHKIIYNDEIAYIAHFSGRYETVVRWTPLRCGKSAVVEDRYLTTDEKKHNAKIIYNYLAYKGWSKNAICGAIANMEAESSLSPGRWETEDSDNDGDKAYGLLQWDPPTKWINYAQSHNYKQNNIYRQLDYLIYSTRYGGGEWLVSGVPTVYQLYAYEYTYSTRSVYDLAIAFLLCYERPTHVGSSVMNYRGGLAETWKEYFDSIGW